jgi:hypothetical protein
MQIGDYRFAISSGLNAFALLVICTNVNFVFSLISNPKCYEPEPKPCLGKSAVCSYSSNNIYRQP